MIPRSISPWVTRSASSQSPLRRRSQASAVRHVRDVGVHLVACRRTRAPARAYRSAGSGMRPGHQDVARGSRARASRPRARRRRRPGRAPRAAAHVRRDPSAPRAQPMFTSACARVLSSPRLRRELERALAPAAAPRSPSSASIASCATPLQARASSIESPSGSRIVIASSAFARAGAPSPTNQWKRDSTRVQRPSAAWSPSFAVDRDRAPRSRRSPSSSRPTRYGGRGQLLEQVGLLQLRTAGRRSRRRGGSGSTPRGSTRARPRGARRRARTRSRPPRRRPPRRGARCRPGRRPRRAAPSSTSAWRRAAASAPGGSTAPRCRASSWRKRT